MVYTDAIEAGNKVIVNTAEVEIYGKKRD